MDIQWRDFQPINKWTPDAKGPRWNYGEEKGQPQFLKDESTGRSYFNESRGIVAFKCFLLTLGTPFVHPVAGLVNIAYRVFNLVLFCNFWMPVEGEINYNFKGRALNAAQDLLKLVATPLAIIGLELAAIYGLFRAYDGRKLYASLERATYGNFILAPCFQPDPCSHLLGGDVNRRNAF